MHSLLSLKADDYGGLSLQGWSYSSPSALVTMSTLAMRGGYTGFSTHTSTPSMVMMKSRVPKRMLAPKTQLTMWLAICYQVMQKTA